MWTLTYNKHKAGVVQGNHYVYDFESLEAARNAIKNAEQIYVAYPHGKGDVLELTAAVRQQMAIIPPQSYPVE